MRTPVRGGHRLYSPNPEPSIPGPSLNFENWAALRENKPGQNDTDTVDTMVPSLWELKFV